MPQVLNTHTHASAKINGVAFTPTKNGMLSEEVPQEVADYFLKIPGYIAVKSVTTTKAAATKAAATTTETPPPSESGEQEAAAQEANEPASEANAANEAAEEAKK